MKSISNIRSFVFFEKVPYAGIDGGSIGLLVTWPWSFPNIFQNVFHFLPRPKGGIEPQSIHDFSVANPSDIPLWINFC